MADVPVQVNATAPRQHILSHGRHKSAERLQLLKDQQYGMLFNAVVEIFSLLNYFK